MIFVLRLFLFLGSLFTFLYVMQYIRKSKVRIEDVMFWIFFCLGILIISIFPQIPMYISGLVGFQSPSNFVFIVIIFVLLVNRFYTTVKLSQTEIKLRDLVERIAIDNKDNYKQ